MSSVFQEQEYEKKLDLGLWKRLIRYAKPDLKTFIFLILVNLGVSAFDAVNPLLTRYAIDHYIVPGSLEGLWQFGLVYGLLIVFQGINIWLMIALSGKIEMGIAYDIRKKGFERLQELSFSYYDRTPVGWIMARMTSDVNRLGEIISWGIIDLMLGSTTMLAIIGIMFYLNWKLTLIAMVAVPFLLAISIYFQQRILKAYREVRKTNSRITGAFNEGIMGAKTTKTLVREKENLHEFKELTGEMYRSSVNAAVFSALYMPIVSILGVIGAGLAIWLGGNGVIAGTISYGTLVAFVTYLMRFFDPIRQIANILAEFQSAQASAERVISMIETEPEIKDSEDVILKYGETLSTDRKNWPEIKGNITFRNVSFAYKEGEKVLENFNLEVKAGETIALVGETGSGKSTIVNLACRFFEPTEGEILIDGVDYRKRPLLWLHSNLGYVLQTPHLFSGTIRDNIRYGRLDATDEEIIRAAKLVNAHSFIEKLENGYDTEVGEGGNRLSTGEKQLISFARAVLANPKIFVLDEATSSIDTETEQMIQDAIQRVLKGRTSFIIAHRLSTIRSADRILVIRDGRILEEGNHYQLLRKKGYYYRLYTNQFMEEMEARIVNA